MKYLLYFYGLCCLIGLITKAADGGYSNYTLPSTQTKTYPEYPSRTLPSNQYGHESVFSPVNSETLPELNKKEVKARKNKRSSSSRKNQDSVIYWNLNNPDDLEKWMRKSRAEAERQLNAMREQNNVRLNSIWTKTSNDNYSTDQTHSNLNFYNYTGSRTVPSADINAPNTSYFPHNLYNSYTSSDNSNSTYEVGGTTYYSHQTYETTGQPKVKRSSSARRQFLRDRGYDKAPEGYEVDHIIPLSEGGSDTPDNMQLLTREAHRRKTSEERRRHSTGQSFNNLNSIFNSNSTILNSTYPTSNFNSTGTFDKSAGASRTIHTGPRGGQYYISDSGNKIYLKKN